MGTDAKNSEGTWTVHLDGDKQVVNSCPDDNYTPYCHEITPLDSKHL